MRDQVEKILANNTHISHAWAVEANCFLHFSLSSLSANCACGAAADKPATLYGEYL
jgi:hypothetical protein